MSDKINEFNIVIVGVGGQGLLTILQIIAEAALLEGYKVRTSELHGLAQRGGSVEVHIRFGKQIFSPLVPAQKADLIMALEMQEALRGRYFANAKTKFMVNKYVI
ncbi:MAG: 2-oxoacid:acceptor oxidoreductase family protein, partial [bacterium]|nr:2-oxoacid:acceptor oxidoreductase family protein [bacterium]